MTDRTATTLTDRYVWTVTRHLPADVGPDVARELRATIADAVDARVEAGAEPSTAEKEAVAELGDPDVLARQYGGRPAYLIGPGVYPDYVRLMRVLPAIVLPLVLVANLAAKAATTDEGWGPILLDAFLLVLTTAVHLAFWVTLTFAVIEWTRPEAERDRPLNAWTPDQLTADVPWRTVKPGETIFEVGFAVALAALVTWQLGGVGDNGIQVLNPDMHPVWKVLLIGWFLVDVAVALLVWRVGRWTPSFAALNVVTNAGAAILVLWLLARDELLTDLPQVLGEKFGWSTDWSVSAAAVGAVIVAIAAWDAVESVLKARRSTRGSRVA
ncbi:permease prefix domain 1-containing protein [Knoellia sp. CPCC 206450]|uniref:permease prefix domain 1-containing protein n=1 Tax=Knoellia tibetensis TaxID=3404798 RepID=UPI003B42D349